MAKYVPKVFEDILQRMVNRVVARTNLTDLTETSVAKTILAAAAREFDDLNFQTLNLLDTFSIDRASGSDLDERAADFNLTRNPAGKATGTLLFSRVTPTGSAISIPIGTRVKVPGETPDIVAVTTAAGSIPIAGTVSSAIAATMEVAGARGNAASGTLSAFKSAKPSGCDAVTNANPFSGGTDIETDDALRARIRAFISTLARSTVQALEFISSTVIITGGKRVVFSKVVEDPIHLGLVRLYVDDGGGTAETTDNNTGTPEILTSGVEFPGDVAQGGEEYLYTDNFPIKDTATIDVEKNASPLTRDVDYTLNSASGQIFLTTPLTAGDQVTIEYTWYTGLIAEVQKVIDGDPLDRVTYPGWRAAGVLVLVLAPLITSIVVEAGIVVEDGFDRVTVAAAVQSALASYINGLGIGNDVVLASLVEHAMLVPGMHDIQFFQPTMNIAIPSDQLSRTVALTDITIT